MVFQVPDLVVNEDDENEEGNWRNDYPDEDGSDREERYGGRLVLFSLYNVHKSFTQ